MTSTEYFEDIPKKKFQNDNVVEAGGQNRGLVGGGGGGAAGGGRGRETRSVACIRQPRRRRY